MDANYYKKYEPIWGSWRITRFLGEGSFGKVFEIERNDFGEVYRSALKAITIPQNQSEIASAKADGMDDASVTAYFRGMVDEIVKEFSMMSKLKGNSNVVSYEDHMVFEHPNGIGWDILIRMELLTPLNEYAQRNTFTRKSAIQLGIDMCKALELCQKYNIIHRDIKPENIFVSGNGDFKLGDFGIARTIERTSGGLSKKGTFNYMAPEVYRGEAYGSSVDLYSLGLVLFRLLNDNRLPFLPPHPEPIMYQDKEKSIYQRISGAKLPAPKNADGRLAEIVLKACAYDYRERFSSTIQMREELQAILYSLEEAPIIYPQGDEAPFRPVEYAPPPPAYDQTERLFGAPPPAAPPPAAPPPAAPGTPPVFVPHSPQQTHNSYAPPAYSQTAGAPPAFSQSASVSGNAPPAHTQKQQAQGGRRKSKMWILAPVAGLVVVIVILIVIFSGGESRDSGRDPALPGTLSGGNTSGGENGGAGGGSGDSSGSTSPGGSGANQRTLLTQETAVLGVPNDQTFASLLWGWYTLYDENDTTAYDENVAFMPRPNLFPDGDEMTLLPFDFSAGPNAFFLSNYYEAGFEIDWMYTYWLTKARGTVNATSPYRVEGNSLYICLEWEIDESGETLKMYDWEEIKFHFDGRDIILTRDDSQIRLVPNSFRADSTYVSVSGYVSDVNYSFHGISSIYYSRDEERDSYYASISFIDGSRATDPVIEIFDDATMTISWEEKSDKWYNRVTEPASYSCRYILNHREGLVLIHDNKLLRYQLDHDGYMDMRLADSLAGSLDNLSDREAETLIRRHEAILDELQTALKVAGIAADINPATGRVTMDTSFLFATGDATLSVAGMSYLDGFLDVYAAVLLSDAFSGAIAEIWVEGHTDSRGSLAQNQTLSVQRAEAVANYCLVRQPDLANIMVTRGHASSYPILDSRGNEDMDASRRVELKFILETGG